MGRGARDGEGKVRNKIRHDCRPIVQLSTGEAVDEFVGRRDEERAGLKAVKTVQGQDPALKWQGWCLDHM